MSDETENLKVEMEANPENTAIESVEADEENDSRDGKRANDELPRIDSVASLIEILQTETAGDEGELWYRGHKDATWLLKPAVYRNARLYSKENALLDQFRQEAAPQASSLPLDQWGWIVFAQHHSLPTRLLDWTQDPLVGLFFACLDGKESQADEAKPVDGMFYTLNPKQLNASSDNDGIGLPKLLDDRTKGLEEYLPGREGNNRLGPRAVIAPRHFDRIRFQTGTFTVSQCGQNPEALDKNSQSQNCIGKFVVEGDSKKDILKELEVLGVNEATVYRDLDRIAKQIEKKIRKA